VGVVHYGALEHEETSVRSDVVHHHELEGEHRGHLRVRTQRGWRDDPALLDRLGP
jgi:hypothetical protein